MKLSNEKEHLVLENQRLVYYIVQKSGIHQKSLKYEEYVSAGMLGLVKAAITFESSKKIRFVTYATKCIKNEIFMLYRKSKKYANDISIDKPIRDDGEGNELTLGHMIRDPESNFEEKIESKENFIKLISIVLNYLKGRERIAILYKFGGAVQREIGEKLNIAQSYVSRVEKKAIKKILEAANQQVHYKEVFSMSIIEDQYKITFSSRDISKFNKIFSILLQKLAPEKLPDFRINRSKERIVIQIPADPESISFIAQIIQEIDDFSMDFSSGKNKPSADNTVSQEDGAKDTQSTNKRSNQVKQTTEGNEGKTTSHINQSEKVMDFILKLDTFSVKQITSNIPDVSVPTVYRVIQDAKTKGLITCVSRGKYVVNKN